MRHIGRTHGICIAWMSERFRGVGGSERLPDFKMVLCPTDYMCADKFAADAATEVKTSKDGIKEGWMGLDIGPDTIKANSEVIKRSNTVFWNGP